MDVPSTAKLPTDLPPEAAEAARNPDDDCGTYVKVSKLGAGGMGEVWKAWDRVLRRWVALKFLKVQDADDLARFRREAQTAAKLNHPHIAAVYGMGEHQGKAFIAMQHVAGRTLSSPSRQDPRRTAELVRDAAAALHYAHQQGVIHRDLKPANLMVEGTRVYVMDFGLAKATNAGASLSATGTILGTPSYMSPEQALGKSSLDPRTDVYSLGATLYELLTGRTPFEAPDVYALLRKIIEEEPPSPRAIDSRISPELEAIVLKCLEKEPDRRYRTALEMSQDLTRWLSGEAVRAHPPSITYRVRKFLWRRRALLGVGAAGIILASAVLLPQWQKDVRDQERARPHLDAGREILTRLDRLLGTREGTRENTNALARQAREAFGKALLESDGHPEALLGIARSYQMEGRRELALAYCDRVLDTSPAYVPACLERALLRLEMYEESRHQSGGGVRPESVNSQDLRTQIEKDLRTVRAWSRNTGELRLADGILAFADGKYEEAAVTLEDYSRSSLSDPRGWAWAGHAWHHVPGKEEEAIRALSEALAYRPQAAAIYHLRGLTRTRQEKWEEAVADYTAAIEMDSRFVAAYNDRAVARRHTRDRIGEMQDYEKALEIDPRSAVAYANRATTRYVTGDRKGAIEDCTRAIEIDPRLVEAYVVRSAARHSNGDRDGAIVDLEKILEVAPADSPHRARAQEGLKRLRGNR